MKTYTDEWKAQLLAGGGITHGAVLFGVDPPVGFWGGYGDLEIDGDTYTGIGARGLVTAAGGQLGSIEAETQLSLSGVDPDQLALVSTSRIKRAAVKIWRLGCNPTGSTVLDATVFTRGRVATAGREEVIGGEAALKVSVEGASSGMGRRGGRMTTDGDQRLIDPDDTALSRIGAAAVKTIYWGGQPPAGPGFVFPGASMVNGILGLQGLSPIGGGGGR